MKPVAVVLAVAVAAPAVAQQPNEEFRALMTRYAQAFNRADAATLAKEFYALPGVTAEAMQAQLADKFGALRKEEFGKMELYGVRTCAPAGDTVKAEISFSYNFTFGGVMPPGDQISVYDFAKTADGWRIVKTQDLPAGQQLTC